MARCDPSPLPNLLIIKSGIEEYKQVFKVIKRFDKRPKQVLVSFTIMEVTLSNGLQHGVEYFIRQQKKKGANISLLADGMSSGFGNVVGNGLKAFSFRQELSTFITLLNSESKVDIISKPNLLVKDGSTSTINIGRVEPIRKGTSVGQNGQESTDIQYRDVGVILSVSVTVAENNVYNTPHKLDIKKAFLRCTCHL
ncbi:MAG: type II secretion system protein GspD [Candidatus Scalindua sp.]